jgi:hypothetical protein
MVSLIVTLPRALLPDGSKDIGVSPEEAPGARMFQPVSYFCPSTSHWHLCTGDPGWASSHPSLGSSSTSLAGPHFCL